MKDFVLRNWGKVCLAFILTVVVIVNFRWGYFVLGNDNYSPEINPELSLKRLTVSPAWRSYKVAGIALDPGQANILNRSFYC